MFFIYPMNIFLLLIIDIFFPGCYSSKLGLAAFLGLSDYPHQCKLIIIKEALQGCI